MSSNPSVSFLDDKDQAVYLASRGAGQDAVIQCLWSYDRPVYIERLRLFHRKLWEGVLSRRIRHRYFPLGRHSWAAFEPTESNLHLGHQILSIKHLSDWVLSQLSLPLDPCSGPPWQLSGQSFDNGQMIVVLTLSHCLADGVMTVHAISEAVLAMKASPSAWVTTSHRPAVGPTRQQEVIQLVQDLWHARITIPPLMRLLISSLKSSVASLQQPVSSLPGSHRFKGPPVGRGQTGGSPLTALSVSIDLAEWQRQTRRAGTDDLSLVVSLAASVARQMSRMRSGYLTFLIPMNSRKHGNLMDANAVRLAKVRLRVEDCLDNPSKLRSKLKRLLIQARREPDFYSELLPLVPFIPLRLFRALYFKIFNMSHELPISCSHMGALPDQLMMIDGLRADDFCFRGVDRLPTAENLAQRGGVLTLMTAQLEERFILNFISHQTDQDNSPARLERLITQSLGNYGMTGKLWPR